MCIGDVEQQPGCHSSGKRQCDCEAVKIPGMTMLKDRKERRAIDRIFRSASDFLLTSWTISVVCAPNVRCSLSSTDARLLQHAMCLAPDRFPHISLVGRTPMWRLWLVDPSVQATCDQHHLLRQA
jgi:hypothetical protein